MRVVRARLERRVGANVGVGARVRVTWASSACGGEMATLRRSPAESSTTATAEAASRV